MLSGMNHLTLAVQSLERSVSFYKDTLGFRLAARWKNGAYLELGDLWLCLSLDDKRSAQPWPEYTHYAFSALEQDFSSFVAKLIQKGVVEWKKNRSEGNSFYFLDPDGHKLEVHVGNLESRLKQCRVHPYADMEIFE
ncbi:glutathione transferase FosA [Escherichia coli]|uniref:Glutathione transferase FosA n=1 Tax=Salmonella enterica subsp. enterica serovar 4,[5],12:i:- TaxID=440524 RepID=A0A8D5DYT7_SALET|nr:MULTISPECIES: fosfomycin resistance glutathione transferase [Enterobacteriaceae]BCI29591.1 glutathione transferase FosA [Salmonella enterica subsp. enterica serovar 4,[5],12:i:-]GJJ30457.1 glutathione transferase FosA [Escherichia coli]